MCEREREWEKVSESECARCWYSDISPGRLEVFLLLGLLIQLSRPWPSFLSLMPVIGPQSVDKVTGSKTQRQTCSVQYSVSTKATSNQPPQSIVWGGKVAHSEYEQSLSVGWVGVCVKSCNKYIHYRFVLKPVKFSWFSHVDYHCWRKKIKAVCQKSFTLQNTTNLWYSQNGLIYFRAAAHQMGTTILIRTRLILDWGRY